MVLVQRCLDLRLRDPLRLLLREPLRHAVLLGFAARGIVRKFLEKALDLLKPHKVVARLVAFLIDLLFLPDFLHGDCFRLVPVRIGLERPLRSVEPRIAAFLREKLLVGTALRDPAVLQHEDDVRRDTVVQPVGDHDDRLLPRELPDDVHDHLLRLGVDVGGSLVENENIRPRQQRPRNRKPLGLPAGEIRGFRLYLRLKPLPGVQEVEKPHLVENAAHLGLGSARFRDFQVLLDGSGKKITV